MDLANSDIVTSLAVYKTMYESVSKLALNARYRKYLSGFSYPMLVLRYFDVSV